MICTSEPGVSHTHPSGFLAAVRIVDAEITIGGGMVTQPANWSVSCEVSRSIPREHPSEGPLRAPQGRTALRNDARLEARGTDLCPHCTFVLFDSASPCAPGAPAPPRDNEGVTSCGVTRNTRTDDRRLEPANAAHAEGRGFTYKPLRGGVGESRKRRVSVFE